MSDLSALFDSLLTSPLSRDASTQPSLTVEAWWASFAAQVRELGGSSTFAWALSGGFVASRVAFAFAAGYQSALHALCSGPAVSRVDAGLELRARALCVTEAGGQHPRAIESRLTSLGAAQGPAAKEGPWRLEGAKRFVIMGAAADELLVIAREGEDVQGRPKLVAIRVQADAPGLRLIEADDVTSLVPEMPHAQAEFRAVAVDARMRLPGDGYTRWVKAFRTVEDIHVFGALLAFAVHTARRFSLPDARIEACMAWLAQLATCAAWSDPHAVGLHRVLATALEGASAELASWPAQSFWSQIEADWREPFARDLALLQLAAPARAARLLRAREGTLAAAASKA